jgi:hypothetical protein
MGAQLPEATRETVEEMCLRWAGHLGSRPETKAGDKENAERLARLYLKPHRFGALVAADLQLHDCVEWVDDLSIPCTKTRPFADERTGSPLGG